MSTFFIARYRDDLKSRSERVEVFSETPRVYAAVGV